MTKRTLRGSYMILAVMLVVTVVGLVYLASDTHTIWQDADNPPLHGT